MKIEFKQDQGKANIGLIIGITAIAVIIVIIGIFAFKNKTSNSVGMNTNSNPNEKIEQNAILDNTAEPQYESSYLRKVDIADENYEECKIVDFVNNGESTFLLTNDNRVLFNNTYGYTTVLTIDDNFKKISDLSFENNLVIENKDNTYTVYNALYMERKMTLNTDGVVAAYWNSNILSVFTLENDYLYYTWYAVNDNGNVEHHKAPAVINEAGARRLSDSTIYNGKIKEVKPAETSIAIMREDGVAYYLEPSSYSSITKEGSYKFNTRRYVYINF